MQKPYARFPKELERNFIAELDIRFWSIFLLTFVIVNGIILHMRTMPIVENLDAKRKLLQQLYPKSIIVPDIIIDDVPDIVQMREEQEKEKEKQEQQVIEEKVTQEKAKRAALTPDEKKAAMEAKRKARKQRSDKEREDARKLTAKFVQLGAGPERKIIGPRKRTSSTDAFEGITDYEAGIGRGGVSLKEANKVSTGGIIDKDADILKEEDLADEKIDRVRSESGIDLEDFEEVTGEGAQNPMRSKQVLTEIVQEQVPSLERCFKRYKSKNPNFSCRIIIRFTILADGSVTRISISGRWSNDSLWTKIEKDIRKKVERWRFPPIERGDVIIELPPISIYE